MMFNMNEKTDEYCFTMRYINFKENFNTLKVQL